MNRFNKMTIALGIGLLATSIGVTAQAETVLIQNATVHTMSARGTLENTDVLIIGNTISRMGEDLPAPADGQIFDAKGKPLTPGLFAGISAIGTTEVSAVDQSVDSTNTSAAMHPEFDVSMAFNPNSTLLAINRVEGFTFTMLGANSRGSVIGGQGRVAGLDGGYDSLFGRRALFITVGGTEGSRASQWMMLNQAAEEARKPATGSDLALLTRAGRQTLERYANGGTVVFNVHRAADILRVLQFAKDRNIKAIINGGAEAWMVADRLAAEEIPVVLNPLQNLPSNFDMLGSRLDNAALLDAAGVTVVFSAGDSHNARKLRQMAGNAVANGLEHSAGLAALTSNAAKVFAVKDDFGSLVEGKRADVVLWSGDPLEVTSSAELVIVNGAVDSMRSRQTLLRDRYLVVDPDMPRAYIKP
jgi:hypothetical protein